MTQLPRFVSLVAVSLGCFDVVRGLVHTVLVGNVGVEIAGLDLAGATGLDQLTLMVAFGYSNFITGAALIYLGMTSRPGALVMLAIIPLALIVAGASIGYWGSGLVGQGSFPGADNMRVYALVCVLTVVSAIVVRWRRRRRVGFSPGEA